MKKLVSMALAICLLCTAFVLPANALTTADFTDIPDNWAKPAIEYCLEKGLMSGVGNGKFNPGGTVNRAQITQVIWNRENKPSIEGLENPFTDVGTQWFAKAVIWCKNNGIVSGNSATTFNPDGPVTRQDICVMVYNYYTKFLKKTGELTDESKMSDTYTDWGKVAGYAKNAVRWANKVSFMSGTSATTLAPTGKATREQLAQFLKNLDKVLENEKPEPTPSPEPEKCEHGNNPETCPICHPSKPVYEGSYRETYDFDETTMAAVDEDFWGYGPTSDDLGSWKEKAAPHILQFDDNAFKTGLYNKPVYDKIMPLYTEGHTYKNFVPAGGWVENGETYPVDIGGHTYTKARGGRDMKIYNRFGIDVTDVDGVMSEKERNMLHVINSVLEEYNQLNGNWEGAYYDPVLQMAAEAMLEEAKENSDNLAKAGLTDLAAGNYDMRVTTSRKILALSKKYNFANNSDLKKESSQLNDLVGGYNTKYADIDYFREYFPNGLSLSDLVDFHSEVDEATYAHDGMYYQGANTSELLRTAPLYEYFGDKQIGEEYDGMVDNGTHFDFQNLIIRTPSDRDYYSTVALLSTVGFSRISTKFDKNNNYPAKIGIAYDEELHQWAILVCETHGNSLTDGRYHNTGDINDHMGWYKAFVTSDATQQ